MSVSATCGFCKSLVVRHDTDVKLIGKQGMIMDDMSPFQVGTSGTWEGKGFRMLGRLKVLYDSGTWSEWYLMFDDGTEGWLAEAQGFYMINFEVEGEKIPDKKNLGLGASLKFKGEEYVVDDRQEITYAGSEGELPFQVELNYQGTSIDLRGKNQKFGNILYDYTGKTLYLGNYVPFADFQFDNLREIHGW